MNQTKQTIEFLVMAQQGVKPDDMRKTLDKIQGLEYVRQAPFDCLLYRANQAIFETLQATYEKLYGNIIASVQKNEIKISF